MTTLFRLTLCLAALALPASQAVRAAELRLHYRAMEKLMTAKAFSADGRRYLQGSEESKCRFTYVEKPTVSAADGRLRIGLQLHTRLGLELSGECVGAADSFPAVLSGVPVYRDGVLTLDDLRLETEGRGYGEALGDLVTASLAGSLQFPLAERIEEAGRIVWQETGTSMTVPRLEIGPIQLLRNQMVVPLDFTVSMR